MTALPSADPCPPLLLTQDQRVASSSGWVAVSLNLGCQGIGYMYQRRWGAFWIGGMTAVGSAVLLGIGSALAVNALTPQSLPEGKDRADLIAGAGVLGAYLGVLGVSIGSAVEAGVAVNRSRRRLAEPPESAEP